MVNNIQLIGIKLRKKDIYIYIYMLPLITIFEGSGNIDDDKLHEDVAERGNILLMTFFDKIGFVLERMDNGAVTPFTHWVDEWPIDDILCWGFE